MFMPQTHQKELGGGGGGLYNAVSTHPQVFFSRGLGGGEFCEAAFREPATKIETSGDHQGV